MNVRTLEEIKEIALRNLVDEVLENGLEDGLSMYNIDDKLSLEQYGVEDESLDIEDFQSAIESSSSLEDFESINFSISINGCMVGSKEIDFNKLEKIDYKSNQSAYCVSRSDVNYVDYTLYKVIETGEEIVIVNSYSNNGHGSLSRLNKITNEDWNDIE